MTTTVEQNVALVRRAYQCVQSRDLDTAEKPLTENFIANVPGTAEPLRGRENWRMGSEIMLDAFPDLTIDVRDIFGVGDKVTVLVAFQATHLGAFQQFEATGRTVACRGVEVYRCEGDRIAEEWVAPDLLHLIQQIAPTPAGH
ncbi:ester cyclase [Streptomyces sp. NPDC020141]|uniref:ester cyclase n=1 Tax=Streptomyces sp. NPDC020141 TaxID=3365065 RepID=UPI00378B3291